ncbi:MAG TPA: flavin reductase [Rhodobacteraceae bacterium]|mgnify:FL=1|jgi:flavin reductase|nr:flavin reductase [Paracoccaceae bacterium]HBG97660.1 flavin reductase [Paracoccaceae bacterium]
MPAIPRDRFLDAMSRVAATVNVVTTDGPGGRAGVTVSAMTPVSADGAAPTLLICLHEDSRTTPAIAANRCFCINVLREDQASLSDRFAGRAPVPGDDKFDGIATLAMPSGAPRLADPLVAFDCALVAGHQVGTHHIFIGAVTAIHLGEGRPLLYGNRAYHRPEPAG